MMFFNPVFADLSTAISVIFLVIAFLGWIMNLVSEKNQPPPPRRQMGPGGKRPGQRPGKAGGDPKLQSEIDVFLQEVQGQRKPKADRNREERLRRERMKREEQQRQEEQQREQQQSKSRLSESRQKKPTKKRSRIEESVREHMEHADHMGEGVTKRAEHSKHKTRQERAAERVQEAIDDAAAGPAVKAENTLSKVMGLLTDPQSVQQAILINEILTRPKTKL